MRPGVKGIKAVITAPAKQTVGFWRGLAYPFVGMNFVYRKHPELKRYWVFPILITFAALVLGVYLSLHYQDALADVIWGMMPDAAQRTEAWWARVLHWLLDGIVSVGSVAVCIVGVIALSTVFAAPFNDALSEAVEAIVAEKSRRPFSLRGVGNDIARTIVLELSKLGLYIITVVPLFIASFVIPVAGQILSVFALALTFLFLAIDYIDWPAARRDTAVRERLAFARKNIGAMLGFGLGTWVLLFIPLLNLFFMPAAVAGATLLYLRLHAPNESLTG